MTDADPPPNGEQEQRKDHETRDRVDEIYGSMVAWFDDANETLRSEQEKVAAKLARGQTITIIVVVVAVLLSSISIGSTIAKQDDFSRQQNGLAEQQKTTSQQAKRLAEVVDSIRQQRIENTGEACEREEKRNRKIVEFIRRAGARAEVVEDARHSFPRSIDCGKRVNDVSVERP